MLTTLFDTAGKQNVIGERHLVWQVKLQQGDEQQCEVRFDQHFWLLQKGVTRRVMDLWLLASVTEII